MPPQPELLVEDGVQAGLSTALAQGASSVGSDLDSAIIIADSALLPSHFEVVVENGRTALRAVSGEVVLSDGTWLAPGENIVCASDCGFTAGNTRFALRPADTSQGASAALPAAVSSAHSPKTVSMVAGIAGVAALGMMVFSFLGQHSSHTARTNLPMAAAPAAHPAMDVASVLQTLRERLDAAGLGSVAIAPSQDGSVLAQGSLFPAQMTAWTTVREWYDTHYGNHRVLVDQVSQVSKGPSLTISAVWAGRNPYVVDEQGDKLFIGAALASGWVIQAIQPGQVIVDNGQQKVAIRY